MIPDPPLEKKYITEHNDLIRAHYDLSTIEQDIFGLLISKLKGSESINKLYHIAVKELEGILKQRVNYKSFNQACKNLLKKRCRITTGKDTFLNVTLLSDTEYKFGYGYAEIGVSKEIRPYLLDLKKNFTKYKLQILGALRSKYSKRIYKMINQFRSTGVMYISVKELKERLGLLDPKTGEEKMKEWSSFSRKVLEKSKTEINELADIRFDYIPKKKGRKFTSIEFRITNLSYEELKEKYKIDKETDSLYQRIITKFKLSRWQAESIIINVTLEEINKTLYEISMMLSDNRIKNVGGYSARVFSDKYNLGFFSNEKLTNNKTKNEAQTTLKIVKKENRDQKQENTIAVGFSVTKLMKQH